MYLISIDIFCNKNKNRDKNRDKNRNRNKLRCDNVLLGAIEGNRLHLVKLVLTMKDNIYMCTYFEAIELAFALDHIEIARYLLLSMPLEYYYDAKVYLDILVQKAINDSNLDNLIILLDSITNRTSYNYEMVLRKVLQMDPSPANQSLNSEIVSYCQDQLKIKNMNKGTDEDENEDANENENGNEKKESEEKVKVLKRKRYDDH